MARAPPWEPVQCSDRLFVVVSGAPGQREDHARPSAGLRAGTPAAPRRRCQGGAGDALGAADYESSHRPGAISMQVLRALLRDIGLGVYDSPWRTELDGTDLSRLPPPPVEVSCDCDPAVRRERIRSRAGTHHPVHFDPERLGAMRDDPTDRPLAGPWPLVRVDTSGPVAIAELAEQVRHAARSAHG